MNTYELGNNLFSSIQMIVDNTVSKANYDRSYLCSIENIESYKDGYKYTLKYEAGNKTVSVYDTIRYTKGKQVWIQVPEGDWNSQEIFIIREYLSTDRGEIDILSYDYNFNNVTGEIYISEGVKSIAINASDSITEQNIFGDKKIEEKLNAFSVGGFIKTPKLKNKGYYKVDIALAFLIDKEYVKQNYQQNYYYIIDSDSNKLKLDDEEYFDNLTDYYYRVITYSINSNDFFGDPYNCSYYLPFIKVFELEDDLIDGFNDIKIAHFNFSSSDLEKQDTGTGNSIAIYKPFIAFGTIGGSAE